MFDNPENVNWLLQYAIEWYADHPGQQIPKEEWESQVTCAWEHGDLWKIELGPVVIEFVPPRVVPGLAAICLGLSSEVLLEVIKHHDIQCSHLESCNFSIRDIESEFPNPSDKSLFRLDAWSVTKAFVDAMCNDDQYVEILENHLIEEERCDIEMACLLSNREALWPSTALSKHVSLAAEGTLDDTAFTPRIISVGTFRDTHAPLESMTVDEIITLLERSGNLTLGVNCENGLQSFHRFFSTIFQESQNFTRYQLIINAINRVEDPIRLATIADRLREVLPDMSRDEKHFRAMQQLLNESRYGSVIDSLVIKLNLLPIADLQLEHEIRTEPSQTPHLNEFFRPEETLKMLQDELIQVRPENFRKPHFDAISMFALNWRVPQNMEGVDIPRLLVHILSALESYERQFHYDKWTLRTDEFVVFATDAVGHLSQMISKLGSVDYLSFSVLSSKSQSLLASHGFEIKKMPGISNHDKGALLSDAIGL